MTNIITGLVVDPKRGVTETRAINSSLLGFKTVLHTSYYAICDFTVGRDDDKREYTIAYSVDPRRNIHTIASAYDPEDELGNRPILFGPLFICKKSARGELASLSQSDVMHLAEYIERAVRYDGDTIRFHLAVTEVACIEDAPMC